jgi:D-xylulose kinase
VEYILSLDLGTTAIKVALFDTGGRLVGKSTQEYTLLTPSALSVELDVETYWQAFKNGVAEVLAATNVTPRSIRALGISAQGETLVLVDAEGRPLRNAIVWMDNRAQDEAESLTREFPREVSYRVTGQVSIVPTWPAAKVLWVRENEPEIFAATSKFLLIEDYFIYRLTGFYAAEGSLLTSTVYWDFNTRKWWKEMLRYLQIEESRLPDIHESGERIGTILPQVARELSLSSETEVCTGALDQAAGAIGVGNIESGVFSENTGAALAVCATVDHVVLDPTGRMPCHYHAIPGMYMEHTFTTGGMVLKWFRDKFCQAEAEIGREIGMDPYDVLGRAVEQVGPGADGLVMLPHLQGAMAPDDNPKAKGVFYGLTLRHSKAHFARAIMEAIGFILRRNIDVIEDLGISVQEIRVLGGGARSAIWSQIKADITGKTVVTMENEQAACLGAAIVAGVGVGLFDSLESACARMVRVRGRFEPDPKNAEIYKDGYRKYTRLYDSLLDVFAEDKVR